MAINVNVQHNGVFLPGIILTVDPMPLPSGNPFKCHKDVLYLQPMIPPKRFDILPLIRLRFFFNQKSARGKCARYARELSFARCHDGACAIILHGSAAGNTSRTGRSTSPAAQMEELQAWARLRIRN